MSLKLITAPAAEPVTLTEAKLHLRVDHDTEDDLITDLIVAAREKAEHLTGRKLISQTWEQVLDAFPGSAIDLETPPVASITSVTYTDTSGADVVLDSGDYTLDNVTDQGRGWLLPSATLSTWPSTYDAVNVVRVRFVAGYGASGASVPSRIRQFMLLEIGTIYKMRESIVAGVSISELPGGYHERMLDPFRNWGA